MWAVGVDSDIDSGDSLTSDSEDSPTIGFGDSLTGDSGDAQTEDSGDILTSNFKVSLIRDSKNPLQPRPPESLHMSVS